MDPISNRPLSALDSKVSFKTASTSNKPNPLPEDIRLRFSYYASEIKNQVDTFYDDQHKWLEDHLLGVQDTFANIKQKKRGTRAVMADIIKTPSRKRIQASSKKKITQPEPLRFEQTATNDRVAVSMKTHPSSKSQNSQNGFNFIPAHESSMRHAEKENPACGSLVTSKAHYDLHSTASDRFATSYNNEAIPSVLGEVQNVPHPHNSRNEPSASNSRSTSRDQTSRVFQPIVGAPTLLKGLGLSSSTQMLQTHTASGVSHHGILNQEEVAALSKSYSSPVKKSNLSKPPSSVTLAQPLVTSQSVPASTSADLLAKDDEPSVRKVVVYTTSSLQHPTVDEDHDEETHDHSGEDTELEEEGLEGHELSAIQEGEEEEDPSAMEGHIPRESVKKTRKEEQLDPTIHTTAQKAKISLPKPTTSSQPTSRDSSDRSQQVSSDSIAHQPAAKLSKSVKSVPDFHPEHDAASYDIVHEETACRQAPDASLHHDTLSKSQDNTNLTHEDLVHHRDRINPGEGLHDTAIETFGEQEVVHESHTVHSPANHETVAECRSDLPEDSRGPVLSSRDSHPQKPREPEISEPEISPSLPIDHEDAHKDIRATTSGAKSVHSISDTPESRNQKITSPERPQAILPSQTLKTSQAALSRSSKTTIASAEHVSAPEADEEPLAETIDVQSERPQSSLPDQNITAEIPLNDDPSRLRNTRAIHSQTFDNNTRTPGPTTQNLFTPGNARAALIRSPQSQWSSKPSNSGWLNKPHKTPGVAFGALGLGIEKGEASRFQGVGGSPVAMHKSDPRISLTSHATTVARAQDIGPQANTISDSQRMLANQRRSSKRTSADAGFPYTSETQEAKIARPYVPVPHRYVPSTADKGKKGVDDLKNRLSKIQRESAMHERTQQVSVVEPLHIVQRASLATSASIIHGKPLIAQSSQTSHQTSTMPPWAPMPPWNAADMNNLNKSQSSRAPASQTSSLHRPISPAPLPSFTTYAGVPLIDRGASSETAYPLHNKASNPPTGLYADSTNSQLPVKKTSVGDLVAAYESKKKPEESAVNATAVARNTSPAPSVTLTHETKSKSPVDTAPPALKSTAPVRSTTPTATPPVLRVDKEVQPIVTQQELHKGDAQGDVEKDNQDDGSVVSEHCEKDLIDLNGKSNRPSHPTLNLPDAEVGPNEDDEAEDEVEESESERQDDVDGDESDGVEATGGDRDAQVDKEDSLSDVSELSPSASNFHDAYASAPSQSSRHASNAGNATPPLDDQGTEAQTPPTSGIMSVFKAGAALATSWTSTKKPELKSLQLAAVAAKKELDDKERKNAIKEEREQRRLAVLEKKQAEERGKGEADRKARAAEADRKKKEREESSKARQTVKAKPAPAATPGHHRDVSSAGDLAKKRKVEADTSSRVMDPKKAKPHKPEPISAARVAPGSALKTSSSSSFQPSRVAPAAPTAPGSVKSLNKYRVAAASVGVKTMIEPIKITHPTPSSSSSKAFQPARQSKLPKPSVAGSSKSKLSTVAAPAALKPHAPSATPKINPIDPKGKKKQSEEYVELPDIDSEYSDDDEEEHQRKEAALPDWAQSMVIRDALANQRKMNPNDIFGNTIPAPPMEEIFRGRASRFRHRTSSANWTGTDQLTALEEAEYAKRMGYHQKQQRRSNNKDK